MDITEVRIKLTEDSDDRLQAFCSITFDDCFVVRDLKIIEGSNGPFVAMPSRKLTARCPRCGCKNHLRAAYCNQCGNKLNPDRAARDQEGRAKLYADIAHPINSQCREMIQQRVIHEYRQELERAKQPGYTSRYDDEYEDDFSAGDVPLAQAENRPQPPPPPCSLEKSQIEPAATEPRAPHQTPERVAGQGPKLATQETAPRRKEGFGAGILDE